MESGIWKKYEKTTRKLCDERASYHDLYDDLKNSRRSWEIAQDIGECIEQLCGVYLRTSSTELNAGDIYIYYAMGKENMIPILYLKTVEYEIGGEKKYFVEYNGTSIAKSGITSRYLPEVIKKLKEIDLEKNKEYIEELEAMYYNHQKLLELQSKTEFTEEELLFLYEMYNRRDVDRNLVEQKIKGRNIQDDYDYFSEEGKVKLFLAIRDTELVEQLGNSSKKVMTLIAKWNIK